ncbi:HAMP domain-containing sensor histidine kinase [Paenibacillus sp. M1]|uniref:histidine kinase n=1 Tax=Paenibacillus haidiansis TaxID=1574488 RepID=A0ABU7VSL0_9BACL
MRKRIDRRRWSFVYAVYGVLFVLLTAGYIGAITYFTGFDTAVGWASLLFVLILLMLIFALVRAMQAETSDSAVTLNEIVDRAISGRSQSRDTGYTESAASALEHKVTRYVELSSSNEHKLEKEKSRIKALISDISHQTKTPLSNIILYSGLLEETPGLSEEARGHVASIKDQSAKLDWLISSLVKMSRLETGIIAIRADLAPVLDTITLAVSQVYAAAEQKGIEVRIHCDSGVQARHDAKWTTEALFNLLENAVKYGKPSGGSITITVQASEMFTRIDVADNGTGIPEGEWNDIFKRFYRGKGASKVEGIGIGLYLTREILTAEGGYIKVSSAPGEGSVFSVFLPAL